MVSVRVQRGVPSRCETNDEPLVCAERSTREVDLESALEIDVFGRVDGQHIAAIQGEILRLAGRVRRHLELAAVRGDGA